MGGINRSWSGGTEPGTAAGSFRPKKCWDSSACLARWAVPPVNDFVVGANGPILVKAGPVFLRNLLGPKAQLSSAPSPEVSPCRNLEETKPAKLQMQRARHARRPFPPFFSGYRSEVWNQQGRRSLPVPKAKPRHARAATAWQMEATAAAAMIARLLR